MALYEIEKNSSGVPTGNYKHVAGRGRAEYGASTVRSGEFTIPAKEAGSASWVQITFAEPMPDTNYEVEFTLSHYWDACSLIPFDKETTGFKAQVGYIQAGAGLSNRTVTYTAYKLYTDTEYNNILEAMPSDASASNKLVTTNSLEAEYTDLASYLSTGWSVREYVRGYKIGKMVIIDFGGLTSASSAGKNQYIMQNLPYSIKNRAVVTLFSDEPENFKKMTVYVVDNLGTIVPDLRANYPSLSGDDNFYGQMIIALN